MQRQILQVIKKCACVFLIWFFYETATMINISIDYQAPAFPSLYNPALGLVSQGSELYYTHDIWRFTLFWTLILYGSTHLAVALYAVAMQRHNWRIIWPTPLIYAASGGLEALLAGSAVGLV
jgi:hypothetical protein